MSARRTKSDTTRRPAKRVAAKPPSKPAGKAGKPKLLSGGNPQIAKAEGDAPVQQYIAAIPVAWKRRVTRRIDELVSQAVPDVRKAVKWNSPLYGASEPGAGWFLGIHMFTAYVKVAFFRGAMLRPLPPGESTQEHVRYLNVREDDQLDEGQFTKWVRQAAALPGERM